MSDRIGVMREGRLVQVGTPNEIYTSPNSKFVSEFIGDVNIIPVRLNGSDKLHSDDLGADVRGARGCRTDSRPGTWWCGRSSLRIIERREEAENVLTGKLYNEYALGSRIQYQVRVGEQVFIVERLRQQALNRQRDSDVLIGWNARDSILVGD